MFSSTMPLTSTAPEANGDALYGAWQAVRKARQTPWEAGDSETWARAFGASIREAIGHLATRTGNRELVWPSLPGRQRGGEGDRQEAERLLEEHRELIDCLNRVAGTLELRDFEQVEEVIRLSEATVLVEMRLARQINRLRSGPETLPVIVDRQLSPKRGGMIRQPVRTSAGLTGLGYDDVGVATNLARRRYALGGE